MLSNIGSVNAIAFPEYGGYLRSFRTKDYLYTILKLESRERTEHTLLFSRARVWTFLYDRVCRVIHGWKSGI